MQKQNKTNLIKFVIDDTSWNLSTPLVGPTVFKAFDIDIFKYRRKKDSFDENSRNGIE